MARWTTEGGPGTALPREARGRATAAHPYVLRNKAIVDATSVSYAVEDGLTLAIRAGCGGLQEDDAPRSRRDHPRGTRPSKRR